MDPLTVLLARFAERSERVGAAADLARRLGVEEVIVFVSDPELGVLLPANGFVQTIKGGPSWRAFLKTCEQRGTHTATVDCPSAALARRVVGHGTGNGAVLMLFGGRADEEALARVVECLPLLGAIFRAEHEARLAQGEAEVARTTSGHARNLALALDAARGEVEEALAESARLNEELKEADRRKDDFLAMLGHELRNPMAAIGGAIEVMRACGLDDRAQTERARSIIERQTEQLARLVDDLLDVARITRGKIALRVEVLDLEAVVRRAMETVHGASTARRHELTIDVKTPVHVTADRTRLEQMVTNLLTNAVKYTDPGGHIRVVVDRDDREASVEVTDDGIGISPAILPHIFDAFLQVDPSIDRSGGGLGVGLTVVSRLAALHGGRVEVTSSLGTGSTFMLRIPAVDRTVASESAVADVAARPSTRPPTGSATKRRVLVVDDNVDSAEMLMTIVEKWGHEAFHADDGCRAVTMARELRPSVVLLDIGLPGLDGYQVAAHLRSDLATRDALIIAVSGYGQDSDRRKSRAAGCDEHLAKPVDLKALARILSA